MEVPGTFSEYLGRVATVEKHNPERISDYIQDTGASAQGRPIQLCRLHSAQPEQQYMAALAQHYNFFSHGFQISNLLTAFSLSAHILGCCERYRDGPSPPVGHL